LPKGSQRVVYTLYNKAKDKAKVIVKDKVKDKDMSILGKIFSSGASDLIESVGTAIDKVHTSAEEKELVKNEIKKIVLDYEQKMQLEVTKRWEADMQGNWLTRSIRPLTLAFLMVVLTTFTLVDFGYVDMDIKDSWIDLWQILAITCFGAYFGGRSYEKIKK
tara:strand:- start:76 stop:561 length:486 start_codon:yes stop_codon:yes gene_type:complete